MYFGSVVTNSTKLLAVILLSKNSYRLIVIIYIIINPLSVIV